MLMALYKCNNPKCAIVRDYPSGYKTVACIEVGCDGGVAMRMSDDEVKAYQASQAAVQPQPPQPKSPDPTPAPDSSLPTRIDWNLLYRTIAHGDEKHKAWLRGMVSGFASATEGHHVEVAEA